MTTNSTGFYKNAFKPVLDFCIALTAFIILSPFFLVIMVLLFISNKGKPFFKQARPGKNERVFTVLKFKTMNDKKDAFGNLLPDSKRLTKLGRFIRKTSLDEIPQLINVIIGDMSLIGPRPLLVKYLPYYTKKERIRFNVKPGITGLAQVSGRNLLGWNERLALDVKYVETLSFLSDVKIFASTIRNVFMAKDIVIDPTSIMKSLDDERRLASIEA